MSLGTIRITMPNGQTREYTVEQASLGVGRAPDNELLIDDHSLSRRHARLSFEAGRMLVEDLGSANGSYVGSQRLSPNSPTLVPDGQTLRLGDVELVYTPAQPTRPAGRPSAGGATFIMTGGLPGTAAVTRFGALRIIMPDGQSTQYSLDQPTITVGRSSDNQLVIEDGTVSRRHARLSVESGRLMIEDLGSANGTYIGGQRLAANTPSLVSDDQPVRVGDVVLRFVAPAPVEAARAFGQAADGTLPPPGSAAHSGPPVNVSLVGPAQPVAPGSVTTANLTIQNRGTVVDEFAVRVSGMPANWVRFNKDRVPLLPGAQEQVVITFQPPRRAEAVATDHRFTISVISREHRTGVNVQGTLKVLPYQGFVVNLQPVRSRRDFQVVAHNQGNSPVTYALNAVDDEHSLLYQFGQALLTLQPGETQNIALAVSPKVKPRIGARETRGFSVVAQPLDQPGAPEVRAAGQLVIRPPIPIWLVPLVILLSLCLCITSAYAYFRLCPTYLPDGPFCPAGAVPIINFFTATPSEVERGGTVVIAWDVSNAETVQLTSPVQNTLGLSGLETFNIDQNTTFTLRATNFAGSVDQSITVFVRGSAPVVETFSANPGVITSGQTDRVVLSWTVLGATSVSIEGVPGQIFPGTGSIEVAAPSSDTIYTLVATNEWGTTRQTLTIVISSADCSVVNVAEGDNLNMREGPAVGYNIVVQLPNGTRVDPIGRNATGDWLKVRALGREGWVATSFINCAGVPDTNIYPTVAPELIPTLAPTPTPVPTDTPAPTATPEPTATPTPTATPLFVSTGYITYRQQIDGRTRIMLQKPDGPPIQLVFDKDDAEVLDFTPHHGGRFAIWGLEGSEHKVFLIDTNGNLVGGPIMPGWTTVTDGDWSNDGQRLVIEAVTGGAVSYHYFDANGNPVGQPVLP
jgi:pSer/pThr/pTyr-binding forkhead associated (FHA) protein